MSKEREVLKEFIDFVDSYEFYPTERSVIWEIVNRANAILAQREPFKPDWANYRQGVADSKREPLSDAAVCEILLKKEWKGFVDLVRTIEKMHGIGGEE